MERLHGLGVMSRMPRASTCPGNEGAAGWQSPAGDTQSCLWQGMVALVAARGHPELPLGMASTVVPWGRLCWAGGLPRLCHSAVPGCVPLCPLSPSVHQSSLGCWFCCCSGIWALGQEGSAPCSASSWGELGFP